MCRQRWQEKHAQRIGAWAATYPHLLLAMLTLTAPGVVDDVAAWNASAAHRFNRFVRDVRCAAALYAPAAPGIEYVRVAEMQRRGLIHYHVLAVEWRWVPFETLVALALKHGFGARVEVKRVRSARGVAGYFVKWYLAKGGYPLPRGVRAIVYSQGWPKVYRPPSDDPVVVAIPDDMPWDVWADMQEMRYGRPPDAEAFVSPEASGSRGRPLSADDFTADLWGDTS